MKVLVKYLTKKRDGTVASRDESFVCEYIRFGRATFNEVNLPSSGVLLSEGILHLREGGLFFESDSDSGNILIDGNLARNNEINIGSVINIGPYDIKIISSEKSFDIILSVEKVRSGGSSLDYLRQNSMTRVSQTSFGKRKLSYFFGVIILGLFFLWPLADQYFASEVTQNNILEKAEQKKFWPMSPDIAWSTGGISGSHKFIGNDCSTCHIEPFVQVRDSVCSSCHKDQRHHVDPDGYYDMSNVTEAACQSCHKEHQGEKTLARSDEGFCANCHREIEKIAAESKLKNVDSFSYNHPEFHPTIVVDPKVGRTVRVSLSSDDLPKENSSIKFPHSKHLKSVGVFVPGSKEKRVLGCVDCHKPSGMGFLNIEMESNCSGCHLLNFDSDVPSRILPHADIDSVLMSLKEFYSDLALRGRIEDEKAPEVVKRRRPGGSFIEDPAEKKEALEWADSKVEQVTGRILSPAGCGTCHELNLEASNRNQIIQPVMISNRWLPKGFFDHAKHTVTSCNECHLTETSNSSEDILLPKIAVCKSCHGGEQASQKVPSTCISCHEFHLPHQGPMRVAISNSE